MKPLIIVVVIILTFANCREKIHQNHPEFIGFWKGNDKLKSYTIRITDDGEGRYAYVGDNDMRNYEGKARYKNGELIIGLKRLTVNQMPYNSEGKQKMEVDGIVYQLFD